MSEDTTLTGRRLDLAIACALFGWKSRPHSKDPEIMFVTLPDGEERAFTWTDIEQRQISPIPAYSSDIADAWKVLEHLRNGIESDDAAWQRFAEFCTALNNVICRRTYKSTVSLTPFGVLRAITPEDICRAALAPESVIWTFSEALVKGEDR